MRRIIRQIKHRRLHFSFGVGTIIIVNIMVLVATSITYMLHSNASATKGYMFRNLQVEYKQLVSESEMWEMLTSEKKSLKKIVEADNVKEMQDIKHVKYASFKNENDKIYENLVN